MACNDFSKYSKGQICGLIRNHFDLEKRAKTSHSNPDINNDLSASNYYINVSDANELRKKLNERIKEIDAIHPPKRMKKDRIVAVDIECYVPLEIQALGETREKEFLDDTVAFYKRQFGDDNVIGASVHLDEQHEYVDSKSGQIRTSLHHAHLIVVPECSWEEKNGESRTGINGFHFIDKKRLTELNKEYCNFTRDNYGIEFNTGEGKSGKSVEELKYESNEIIDILHNSKELGKKIEKQIEVYNYNQAIIEGQEEAISENEQIIADQQALMDDNAATFDEMIQYQNRDIRLDAAKENEDRELQRRAMVLFEMKYKELIDYVLQFFNLDLGQIFKDLLHKEKKSQEIFEDIENDDINI